MIDSTIVTIHLTEIQRVQAILRSDAPGGNIKPLHINTQVGICRFSRKQQHLHNLVMTEFADTGSPMLINASINYSTGVLLMFFNETIKCDPLTAVDVTQVTLVNETSKTHFSLSNTTHVVVQNETFVNVTLTEAQRVIAIAVSGPRCGECHYNLAKFGDLLGLEFEFLSAEHSCRRST